VTSSVVRGILGRSQAIGSAHTTYQGRSTGPSSASSTRTQPHAAPSSKGSRGEPAVERRHTSRASAATAASSTSPKTRRTTHPSVPNDSQSSTRPKTAEGASQPSCVESCTIPRLGSRSWRYGTANASAISTAAPPCTRSARRRPSAGRDATTHTRSSSSGSAAVAFTSVPSASTTTAASGCRQTTKPSAPTTARATSRSLCPLATEWNSTTGLAPNAASAKAVLSGRSLRATRTIAAQVARLAPTASQR
jgi:hypothetical protein